MRNSNDELITYTGSVMNKYNKSLDLYNISAKGEKKNNMKKGINIGLIIVFFIYKYTELLKKS